MPELPDELATERINALLVEAWDDIEEQPSERARVQLGITFSVPGLASRTLFSQAKPKGARVIF